MSVPAESPKVPVALFYNPDWLSDDDLLNGFTARLPLLDFLRDELCRSPLRGTVQHMLLVGVRGSGKTTLLKRLAVAIRRETGLADHLVALSFPEELYQVKGLADLWWAACEALEDALHEAGEHLAAAALTVRIEAERFERPIDDVHDEHALRLLLQTCSSIGRRPVLLIDNLDLVLDRIDKSGRKTRDPHSRAYWALREALSSADAPIVIGGSARLGEPLVGYDKAFYDFFVPHRLGKLTLEETRDVFDHLAERQGGDELRQRIRQHPGRVQALYEMTGGNPRALILIFELLRQGVTGRAVDDFERLLDLTTPCYKARFEELPEQAQIVMHALAMSRREPSGSNYGHTASIIARRAGLETRTVSSQLEVLIKAGAVEKSKTDGDRTRYRIGEQLFRLWLQMRSSRRLRAQVVGLTEFLEALFGRDVIELDSTDPVPCSNLGLLLADDSKRGDGAGTVSERALMKDPETSHARWRLAELHMSRAIEPVGMALESGDRERVEATLKALRAHVGLEPGWPASDRFVQGVVATALKNGQGTDLLTLLRDLDFETIAAPLLMALEAVIANDRERLSRAEPEIRGAALHLFEQLQTRGSES